MAKSSKAAVIGAIAANFSIAAIKLLVGIAGESSAMVSESVHSAVDGINDLLLLLGIRRSRKPPDQQHPFGYGKELYFWALIVSCSVFAVGGVVAAFEGLQRIGHPEPLSHPGWMFFALGCGALFDLGSLMYSLKKFRQQNQGKVFHEAVDETKDPATLMVVIEDLAGLLGELIAASGIFIELQHWGPGDGIASVLIGCLLAGSALFLISQNRDLIVGEGLEDDISRSVRELAVGQDKFVSIRGARTMYFGPETVLITMDAMFDPQRKAGELMEVMDRVQRSIREKYPVVKYIYIDPESSSTAETRIDSGDARLPRVR